MYTNSKFISPFSLYWPIHDYMYELIESPCLFDYKSSKKDPRALSANEVKSKHLKSRKKLNDRANRKYRKKYGCDRMRKVKSFDKWWEANEDELIIFEKKAHSKGYVTKEISRLIDNLYQDYLSVFTDIELKQLTED